MTEQPSTFPERDAWMRAVLRSDLPPVAVRVALVVGFHLNVEFGRCYPGIDDIKIASGGSDDPASSRISERSTYRQLALLEKEGWLAIRRVRRPGRNNEYMLLTPAKAMAGIEPEETCQNSGRGDLPKQAIRPATTLAGQNKRTSEATRPDAKASGQGERARELTLADPPPAPAPDGGALKDKFELLLSIYFRHYGVDKTASWTAFVQACGNDSDIADDILASARRWVAARPPEKLQRLETWLSQGAWKNLPPPQKQSRNNREPTIGDVFLSRFGDRS